MRKTDYHKISRNETKNEEWNTRKKAVNYGISLGHEKLVKNIIHHTGSLFENIQFSHLCLANSGKYYKLSQSKIFE